MTDLLTYFHAGWPFIEQAAKLTKRQERRYRARRRKWIEFYIEQATSVWAPTGEAP